MNVPAMSPERHERGIHAVWIGGPGLRPGGTGVTGARRDAPAPQTPKPRNTRTQWIRGFIAYPRPLAGSRPVRRYRRRWRDTRDPRDPRDPRDTPARPRPRPRTGSGHW